MDDFNDFNWVGSRHYYLVPYKTAEGLSCDQRSTAQSQAWRLLREPGNAASFIFQSRMK
jgi:hypothetical protein